MVLDRLPQSCSSFFGRVSGTDKKGEVRKGSNNSPTMNDLARAWICGEVWDRGISNLSSSSLTSGVDHIFWHFF